MTARSSSKVVLVTGANEGIGYHLASSLLEDGYSVAVLDIEVDGLDTLAESHPDHLWYRECDVTDPDAVQSAIDATIGQYGHVDILVNNAAVFTAASFGNQSLEELHHQFDVNYFGYVHTIRSILPHMRARGHGIIHNVSSGAGLVGHPQLSGYASTKGAIEALTRTLRLELQHDPIAITRMHPALTNTRSAATIGYSDSLLADPEETGRRLANQIESTRPVIYADLKTRFGLWLSQRFPIVVRKGTAQFVDEPADTAQSP